MKSCYGRRNECHITKKKYGSCVAVLLDRMVVFCLSYSLGFKDSDDLFLDAIGPRGGKLHRKLGKFFREKSTNSNLSR